MSTFIHTQIQFINWLPGTFILSQSMTKEKGEFIHKIFPGFVIVVMPSNCDSLCHALKKDLHNRKRYKRWRLKETDPSIPFYAVEIKSGGP